MNQPGGGGRTVAVVRPFRSHRTLQVRPGMWLSTLVVFIIGVAGTYGLMRLAWPHLMDFAGRVTGNAVSMLQPVDDNYLGIPYIVLVPGTVGTGSSIVLAVVGMAALALTLMAVMPNNRTPLRYWVAANVMALMGSALFLFFNGHVGYDSQTFMLLVERTSILMIVCAPAFLAIISILLPFSFLERLSMVAIIVVTDMLFATVRVSAFAVLDAQFGGLAQSNLYLFFGPLMDVTYFIAIYSFVAVMLGRRIARTEEVWAWL
jgi:hypothetical protein